MSTTPGDAPVNLPDFDPIPALAELYDKFAHALDPFSEERDEAEAVFQREIAMCYDSIEGPKPTFHEFRKGVISRCKKYLTASDKPQDKRLLSGLDENTPS